MEQPLTHVWKYAQRDRDFWDQHLEDFVPRRVVDAHVHILPAAYLLRPPTPEMRRQYWVNEVVAPIDAPATQRCNEICYPGRQVSLVALGAVDYAWDIEGLNRYLQRECPLRAWHCLATFRPQMSAQEVTDLLEQDGVLGAKVYYSLIGDNPLTRDEYIEAGIFDFLPHHQLEVLNDRGAWVTLHVPRAGRLGHPDNLREVREIRRRYPKIVLVLAHLGRCYTQEHAMEGLVPLADDPGIYFDNSAVMNPESYRVAHEHIGIDRLLYGTDNPVFYMRGRRQYQGRSYLNRTDYPFHFNQEREAPEIEAHYTLFMYEALKAIKEVCQAMDYGKAEVAKLFHGNAESLIAGILQRKAAAKSSRRAS